jgi:hypothetical protein
MPVFPAMQEASVGRSVAKNVKPKLKIIKAKAKQGWGHGSTASMALPASMRSWVQTQVLPEKGFSEIGNLF